MTCQYLIFFKTISFALAFIIARGLKHTKTTAFISEVPFSKGKMLGERVMVGWETHQLWFILSVRLVCIFEHQFLRCLLWLNHLILAMTTFVLSAHLCRYDTIQNAVNTSLLLKKHGMLQLYNLHYQHVSYWYYDIVLVLKKVSILRANCYVTVSWIYV